jgi:signal transduction histidine kinase
MPRFLSSLRVRLLLLVLAAALPGLGLIVYEGLEQRELAATAVEQHALHLAREVSREHERYIEGARQLLITLARFPEVRKLQADSTGAFFADILRQFPIYTNLAAVKPNGDLFASGLPLKEPTNIADRPYFQQVLKARDFAISEYLIGRLSGKPNITIAYPAVDKSEAVQAVVFVGLSLDWVKRFLVTLQLPDDAAVTLKGHDGTVITRHPDPEKWIGRPAADTPVFKAMSSHEGEGTVAAPGLDGVRRLYGFTTLRGLALGGKIYVSVGIPEEAAFAEVKKDFYRHLGLMGAVLLISIALVWFGAGLFITRPVEELVGATRRLAEGDLSARTGLSHGEGELAQLAYSFDHMAESLEQNITERKRAEEELKKQAEELKKVITEMEISNKVKDQFLSVMSHELRTPLNVVLGYTGMLRDGMLGEIPPKQKEVLGKVINRAGDLLTLIRDILQATQIESRSVIVERQLVSLLDFLDKLKAGYDQPLDKDLTLNWDYPANLPPLITDSDKLKQILQNLIHNAIKFTERGAVSISARYFPLAKTVEFQVADTGIGIPREALPFIFEKFRQADSSETRIYGGVGLGLYIVKKLTELLGGTVEVESESGKGSIFTVTLPLEQ